MRFPLDLTVMVWQLFICGFIAALPAHLKLMVHQVGPCSWVRCAWGSWDFKHGNKTNRGKVMSVAQSTLCVTVNVYCSGTTMNIFHTFFLEIIEIAMDLLFYVTPPFVLKLGLAGRWKNQREWRNGQWSGRRKSERMHRVDLCPFIESIPEV